MRVDARGRGSDGVRGPLQRGLGMRWVDDAECLDEFESGVVGTEAEVHPAAEGHNRRSISSRLAGTPPSCRHAIPPRTMYRMASTIARWQCFSGRPPRPAVPPGAGNSGSRIAHSASVTDDEYTAQPCPPAAWGGHDGHGEIGSWSGRDLVNHRPNQEPTSSVLREAHARPSRFSNTLLEAPRPCASLQARRQAAATSCIAGFVAAGCGRFIVFAGGSVMRYCRFFALAAG